MLKRVTVRDTNEAVGRTHDLGSTGFGLGRYRECCVLCVCVVVAEKRTWVSAGKVLWGDQDQARASVGRVEMEVFGYEERGSD